MIQLIEFGNDLIIHMSVDDNGYKAKKKGPEKAAFFVTIGLEGVDQSCPDGPGVRR